jgi:hypothetical protein
MLDADTLDPAGTGAGTGTRRPSQLAGPAYSYAAARSGPMDSDYVRPRRRVSVMETKLIMSFFLGMGQFKYLGPVQAATEQ